MKTHCKATATALITSSFFLLPSSFLLAKTFDWPIEAPTAGARLFTAYHGETVSFNLKFGGAMTNLSPVCIYYQTNGMDKAEWFGPIPGTVFHPTNDCGAATYRFFIRSTDPDGVDYTANGTLRLLDSPGFEPSEVQLPVRTLDFSKIEVLHPPWGEGGGVADLSPATNYTDSAIRTMTEKLEVSGEITPLNSVTAGSAVQADTAKQLGGFGEDRFSFDIFAQLDAATATNAAQSAAIAGKASTNDVCNIVTNEVAELQWVYYDLPDGATVVSPPHGGEITIEVNGIEYTGLNCDQVDDVYYFGFWDDHDYMGLIIGAAQRRTTRNALGLARLSDLPPLTNGLARASAIADIAATVGTNTANIATVGAQVNAIGAHLNAEDAHFVSTNYDSAVRLPEAYVEIRMRDQATGSNTWITIWQEMRRWTAFVGAAFDWNTWSGFHAWATNITAQLSFKADRCWGIYDSETGGYSPEGYTQISSSNILIAAGMAYQRTVTSAGSVWVLQCNQGVAHIGGDTNGFFRVLDGDGNVQFEIVKGDKQELGCDASGITVGANNAMTIPYSVDAATRPKIQCCNNLTTANWKDEEDPDCLCTVSWSGTSGAYVATVTPKTAQTKMFVKATYMAGGETYIRNVAPVGMGSIILPNGTKYYLGTATISGYTVLTLSTTAP